MPSDYATNWPGPVQWVERGEHYLVARVADREVARVPLLRGDDMLLRTAEAATILAGARVEHEWRDG